MFASPQGFSGPQHDQSDDQIARQLIRPCYGAAEDIAVDDAIADHRHHQKNDTGAGSGGQPGDKSDTLVTASHNENGWTGVKMGAERPLTFGPDEMGRLKDIVLAAAFDKTGGGSYRFVEGMQRVIARTTRFC